MSPPDFETEFERCRNRADKRYDLIESRLNEITSEIIGKHVFWIIVPLIFAVSLGAYIFAWTTSSANESLVNILIRSNAVQEERLDRISVHLEKIEEELRKIRDQASLQNRRTEMVPGEPPSKVQ